MSGFNTTAMDAAVVCLRVMRRLLQDEEMTLAQLNYLIENIHDPLAEACLPPSQRPIIPTLAPSSPQPSSRAGSVTRQHCVSALARTLSQSSENDKKSHKLRQSPQPVMLTPPLGGLNAAEATSPTGSKQPPNPIARKTASKPPARQVPLTFSQYWDLFANLPTLYAVQLALVQQLEGIIQRLFLIMDELQPLRESLEAVPPLSEEGASHHNSANHTSATNHPSSSPASPDAHAAAPPTSAHGGSRGSRRHVSALRFPMLGSVPSNRGVYGEIGVMVNDFFGSDLMQHFMAEHLMYTAKYTQRAAPQLLRLSRVWRWTGGAAPSASSLSRAALANLCDADRSMLLQHALFLDFLWRTFGRDGVPPDSRISITPSLESHAATTTQASMPTETVNTTSAHDATAAAGAAGGSNNGNNSATNSGGQRRVRTPAAGAAAGAVTGGGGGSTSPTSTNGGGSKPLLPPIPAMWEGFRTILALLATPLGGLRRYSHVARCLVESGALQPKDRDRLQESFIDVVAFRMSEETNLVMEELWTQDVAGIMALIDMPGSRPANDKTSLQTSSRRTGTGGVGAAGVGGAGLHDGHTNVPDSVSGTASAAVAAAVAASLSGAPSPTSSATGVGGGSTPSTDYSNRALIHYGRLSKRFGRGRHERLAFLFSDWMCYVEECSNGRFRVRGTIPLPGLRVIEVRDGEAGDAMHGFELLSPHLPKRLIFFTSSPEQRGQWVDAIRYTVRRFCDQHQPRQGANAVANASVVAPAVTMGETGLPSVMRATAPMLSAQSRLSRQRRYDGVWQDYVDVQRRMKEAFAPTSPIQPGMSSASLGGFGGAVGSLSSTGHSPPPPVNLSGDPSRDSSFAGQRSTSTHRQLEFDVTPWSQHASVHRRIRSQDLFAAHQQQQQQQQQATGSSSRTASPTHFAGTRLNASLSAEPEGAEKPVTLPGGGSVGNASMLERATSLPGEAEEGPSAARLPTPLLLSPSTTLPGKSSERRRSSSVRSAFLEAVGSASVRIGGSGVLGTPLRRPVSERFEAVKSTGNSNQVNSSAQQQQLRRSGSIVGTEISSSSGLTRAATTPLIPTAAVSDSGRTDEKAGDGNAAEVEEGDGAAAAEPSPPPHDSEVIAGDQIMLEDSTTEPSAPVEDDDEEEGEEESEGDAAAVEEESESDFATDGRYSAEDGVKERQRSRHGSGPQPLYSDVLLDATCRQAETDAAEEDEDGEESSHTAAHTDDSGRAASTEKLDRLIANSSAEEPVGSAKAATAESAGAPPLSQLREIHEKASAANAMANEVSQDDGSSSLSRVVDQLKAGLLLDKQAEEEDAGTMVVTAFHRTNSPDRGAMSPISPVQLKPQQAQQQQQQQPATKEEKKARGANSSIAVPDPLLLTASTELDPKSQSAIPISGMSTCTAKEDEAAVTGQRSRHVDPAAK